ncbi:hypothetical protein [Microlunatus sp. GCM10028923]|uniref:hypothetical protein n=1 Tax=Microlunatus sp. GCM10028923 TaxID=3273400 RepID=UPI003609DC32
MSQSAAGPPAAQSATATAPAPAPAGQPAAVVPVGQSAVAVPASAEQPSLTPRRLRQLMVALVVGALLFGVLGAVGLGLQAYALGKAEENTAQLIRVQEIQTHLLTADATATNAFLVGGLEPPAQRETYDAAISNVNRLIVDASDAQPADAEVLQALNTQVNLYTVAIEEARANNRQGFPVGAQYLREASAQLRTDALPILDNLVAANTERADREMSATHPLMFQIAAVLILIGYVLAMIWLARRFKRTINIGVLVGGITLLLSLIIGGIVVSATGSAVNGLRDGAFTDVTAAAEARIEAGDAKSNESLTLIARGSGSAFEKAWQESSAEVAKQLQGLGVNDLRQTWTTYSGVHEEIRKLDDGGNWDGAVEVATGTGEGTSNHAYNAFDSALASYISDTGQETRSGLNGPGVVLIIGAGLIFVGGIVAAAFARRGVAVRLREYQ